MSAGYPAEIWDGESVNRNSDNKMAPDHRDWSRMFNELRAVQKSNRGIDPDTIINNHGTLAAVTGLTVEEYGNAAVHKTVITLDEVDLATTDGTGGTYAAFGTLPIYTFPEGHLVLIGGHQVYPVGGLEATLGGGGGISDTGTFEIGVGSTARGDAENYDLHTITTDDDIVPLHIAAALVGGESNAIEFSQLTTAVLLDGSASAVVANLNICSATDDTDHGAVADVMKVSGTITLIWTVQGDD